MTRDEKVDILRGIVADTGATYAMEWFDELVAPGFASDNSASLSCQSCRREHCSRSNPTCMACVRFVGERQDWHEQA